MLTDVYVIGEGLVSDQTSTLTFGLGSDEVVSSVSIRTVDGESIVKLNPEINKVHKL